MVFLLRAELLRLADRVAVRLRRAGWEAGAVAIKVRFADFSTITRSQTLPEPSDLGQRLGEAARELFAGVDRRLPIRLIGVRAERLRPAGGAPAALWDEEGAAAVVPEDASAHPDSARARTAAAQTVERMKATSFAGG